MTSLTVNEGDVIRIRTGNGGGYGDPSKRDSQAISADLENGLITAERSRQKHGSRSTATASRSVSPARARATIELVEEPEPPRGTWTFGEGTIPSPRLRSVGPLS